jgi:hypothetical protein
MNMPFPSANPTVSGTAARSVVQGRYAECSIGSGGGVVLVLLFDWEITVNFDYADATAHGDLWKQKVFLDGDWTARARGYVVPGSTTQYINSGLTSGVPATLTFAGWSGAVSVGAKLWEGPCKISRGVISAPMALMTQEIELVSSGTPTAGI